LQNQFLIEWKGELKSLKLEKLSRSTGIWLVQCLRAKLSRTSQKRKISKAFDVASSSINIDEFLTFLQQKARRECR
jgi:hypothetical protein